jgi:hypothetical protein
VVAVAAAAAIVGSISDSVPGYAYLHAIRTIAYETRAHVKQNIQNGNGVNLFAGFPMPNSSQLPEASNIKAGRRTRTTATPTKYTAPAKMNVHILFSEATPFLDAKKHLYRNSD